MKARKNTKTKKNTKSRTNTKSTKTAIRKIGFLHSGKRDQFRDQISALKYALLPLDVEVIEKYAADLPGDIEDNLHYLAEGLVQDSQVAGPDRLEVIVAAGGPGPALLLQELTKNLKSKPPIVFTTVVDPKGMGLVKTEATPTYNLTGTAGQTSELDPVRLETLFQWGDVGLSKGDKIGVLVSKSRPKKDGQFKHIKDKADGNNLKLVLRRRDVSDLQEIENAFAGFANEPVKGVLVTADSLFNDLRKDVVRCANAYGLPTIYQWKEFVDLGGLISHGPDILEAYGKAGEYVRKILGGQSPSTLACSRPSPPKTYINRATAQQFGIKIPKTLLGHPVRVV